MPYAIGQQGRSKWEHGLVGYFIGKKLPFTYVKQVAMNIWKDRGLIDVIGNEKGFFFFDFGDSNLEGRDEVLDGGPWYFAKQPIILKKWDSRMPLDKDQPSSIPIWAKLYNVPWEYWTKEGFSLLGSAIGKPVYVDKMTEDRARVSFIRMCVEVDASMPLVKEFELEMEGAEENDIVSTLVEVEYQWTPLRCGKCRVFGHNCERGNPPTNVTTRHPTSLHLNQEWKAVSRKGKEVFKEQLASLNCDNTPNEAEISRVDTKEPEEGSCGEAVFPSVEVVHIDISSNETEGQQQQTGGNRVESSRHVGESSKVMEAHLISHLALKNVFEDLQEEENQDNVSEVEEKDKETSLEDNEENEVSSDHDYVSQDEPPKLKQKGGKTSSKKKKKKKNRR